MKKAFWLLWIFLAAGPALLYPLSQQEPASPGEEVYMKRCKTCHGPDGRGNEAIARLLKVEFKAMSSPEVQKKSDEEIRRVIREGTGKMRPVAGISDEEIKLVISYLRTLKDNNEP